MVKRFNFDTPPADGATGPQGPQGKENGINGTGYGKDGTNGAAGSNGVERRYYLIIHDYGRLGGNTVRTISAPSIKGMKFVSVRASLRGKGLPVHGRTITVDLRGKTAGSYTC